MSYPSMEELECDGMKSYCSWEGAPCVGGPNGPICCEGVYCKDAYESWKADHVVTCEVCEQEVDKDICIEDSDNCHKFYICEVCCEEFGRDD